MTAPDLTKLTAKELHDTLSTGLTSWTPPLYAVMREFVRRAEGYALACADRDSARDELAEMKALRDAAKSDHKEACRILRNYQTIAEERGREIKALIRERDELHRRAQANDALRSAATEWANTVPDESLLNDNCGDCVKYGNAQAESYCGATVLRLLAAAPAAPPTSDHIAGVSKMVPVLYHLDDGKVAAAMLVAKNTLVVDLMSGDGPSVVGKDGWFEAGYVATYGGMVPEAADEGTEPGQWSYGVRKLPQFLAPAAQPTPAAPVTDAEIEAAITALTVDARREADALRVNPEASGTATEKRANRQVQLRALIERRVASAGAAPVDSEREAAIEAWIARIVRARVCNDNVAFDKAVADGCSLMRSAPAPAGDDAKLRDAVLPIAEALGMVHVADYAYAPASTEEMVREIGNRRAQIQHLKDLLADILKATPSTSSVEDLPHRVRSIVAERDAGYNARRWAEALISQLHANGHEGAGSWLMNHGVSPRSAMLRDEWATRNPNSKTTPPRAPVDPRTKECGNCLCTVRGGCERAQEIDRLLAAPPAPAGDQDAKLRERLELRSMLKSCISVMRVHAIGKNTIEAAEALLAAPAASAIAAAPEAPAWVDGLQEALAMTRKNATGEPLDAALLDVVHWLRDGLLSQARRIEALENKEMP